MNLPWIIALISTDYDLKDERKAIIDFLKTKNIKVSAFEEPDFPNISGVHSHDNCLQALQRADIAILVVNSRYGGKYYLNQDVSITEEEYNNLKIPTVVLVNNKVWDERVIYHKQRDNFAGKAEDFHYYPQFIKDIEIFDFIDRIQDAYNAKGRANWMNYWNDISDLINHLPSVLSALSVNIIRQIKNEQIKEVRAKKTSTTFSMSLGDVFEKGYYIEPEYELLSGNMDTKKTLSEAIIQKMQDNESCVIIADAGAGKTTLVARSFLTEASDDSALFDIPIYVWLKSRGVNYEFSIDAIIKDSLERYLHKQFFPFFDKSGFRFHFFLDGFDELSEKLTLEDLKNINSSEFFQWPVVLTSRSQYAERYMLSNDFMSKFSCQIRIKEWSEDMAKKYIAQFCELQGKDDMFKERISGLLTSNEELKNVLKSPLLVTVLLYVIEHNRMEIPETVNSRVTLLQKCLELLAQREIDTKIKKEEVIPNYNDLVLQWAYFAWSIYEERLKRKDNPHGEGGIHVEEAIEYIKNVPGVNQYSAWPMNIYDAIFDVIDDRAVGTFHEQFLEFLVAYSLVYACQFRIQPYPDFLKYVMRPEINRYFRGLVEQKKNSEKKQIVSSIHDLYMSLAGSEKKSDIAMRVHAVYHLSRISGANDDGIIDRIFNIEKELAVLQSLYFGIIKKGDLSKEKELYELLSTKEEYSDANRGYHLAYYDSLQGQKELPYSDDISIVWNGTLKAFIRHFGSNSAEHYYLRRIDILTMMQFIKHRQSAHPLTEEGLLLLESRVNNPPIKTSPEYQRDIEVEFDKLKEAYYKFK